VLDRFLEIPDPFTYSFSHFGEPFGAEQKKDNDQDDDQFWHA
jgi:hypothetical protein